MKCIDILANNNGAIETKISNDIDTVNNLYSKVYFSNHCPLPYFNLLKSRFSINNPNLYFGGYWWMDFFCIFTASKRIELFLVGQQISRFCHDIFPRTLPNDLQSPKSAPSFVSKTLTSFPSWLSLK